MVTIRLRPRSDFYFTVTGWELTTLRHLHRVVEENADELLARYGIAKEPGAAALSLELMLVESRALPLFRLPMLAMAWALFEACLVETSQFFSVRLGIPYSVESHHSSVPAIVQARWRKWSPVRRAKHFFDVELNLAIFETPDDEEALERLRMLRNIVAHAGGRVSRSNQRDWRRLEAIASEVEGLDISTGYVVPSQQFVEAQLELIDRSATFFINGSRRIVTDKNLDRRP